MVERFTRGGLGLMHRSVPSVGSTTPTVNGYNSGTEGAYNRSRSSSANNREVDDRNQLRATVLAGALEDSSLSYTGQRVKSSSLRAQSRGPLVHLDPKVACGW